MRLAACILSLLLAYPAWAAFGDLDQVANSGAASGTQTCALTTPTSGDLLIFVSPSNSGGATISTPPGDGFTELTFDNSGDFAAVWYYKISEGDETSISITWSAGNGTAICAEYDFGGNTLGTVSTDEDLTNVSAAAATSQDTGSVTPDNSTNIVLATIMGDSAFNIDGSPVWTNSFTADQAIATQGSPFPALARRVSQTGSQTTNYSVTDTGDGMYGAIASFSIDGGGSTILPLLNSYYR